MKLHLITNTMIYASFSCFISGDRYFILEGFLLMNKSTEFVFRIPVRVAKLRFCKRNSYIIGFTARSNTWYCYKNHTIGVP